MIKPIKKHTPAPVFISELLAGIFLATLLLEELTQPQLQHTQDALYLTCLATVLPGIYLYQSNKPALEYLGSLLGKIATTGLGFLLVTYAKSISPI